MINKVNLLGRVGKDSVMRNEKAPVNFGFATWESYKDKEGEWQTITTWHDIVCWGDPSYKKYILNLAKRGVVLYIEGKIVTNEWEDAEGNKRQAKRIHALSVKNIPGGQAAKKAADEDLSSDDEDLDEDLEEDDSDDLPF